MAESENTAIVCMCMIISLFTTSEIRSVSSIVSSEDIGENCFNSSTVTITDQTQLDKVIQDLISSNNSNTTQCIHWSFVGNTFQLDLVQLMRINIPISGTLAITGNSVNLQCTSNITDQERLQEILQPISRAHLVLFDGLVFTQCPVPIVIEEVYNVMILNCVFL